MNLKSIQSRSIRSLFHSFLGALCLLAPLVLSLRSSSLEAATYFVRESGEDQADGQTPNTAFATLRRAIQAVNHGDSIVLGPGTYAGGVLLAERFHAAGEEMSITGDESGQQTGDTAGPVVITANDSQQPAIHLFRLRNFRIAGLTVRGSGQGIKIEKCRDVIAERLTLDGLARGLAGVNSSGVRVESSVIQRCSIGLAFQGTVHTRVAHVTLVSSSSVGLMALNCGEGELCNSLLTENNTNLIADTISAEAWSSDHNAITGTCGTWGDVPPIAKIHEWPAASGQDRHSVLVVPRFVDPDKFDLRIANEVSWGGGLPGAKVGKVLDPPVVRDRAGQPFEAMGAGAYRYPASTDSSQWQKLVEMPKGQGSRQSAGVYTSDGILLRTLLANATGVHELWWDGRDDQGEPVSPGKYEVRTAQHAVQIVDDGAIGDDGNPLGAYNCDNADRVVALPDGGFVITTVYDEAGFPLRRYSSTGQPIFATNLTEKDFSALARWENDLYGIVGPPAKAKLIKLNLPGVRIMLPSGDAEYPITTEDEKTTSVGGLTVDANRAYVALQGLNVVRVIDLSNGKKIADWPIELVGDIALDEQANLWVVSGQQVVRLDAQGRAAQQVKTPLASPRYLSAAHGKLAVADRINAAIAVLDAKSGQLVRQLGKPRPPGDWTPVSSEIWRDPRGLAFLPDGRLVVTEQARVRIIWPETGKINQELLSNFMDVAVVHPTQSEYVYCSPGVFKVDPASGAWQWLVEEPRGEGPPDAEGKKTSLSIGRPATAVVLEGKPFLAYFDTGRLRLLDISSPLKPRLTLDVTHKTLSAWAYATVAFTKNGDLVTGGHYGLQFQIIPFAGLDAAGNPQFDFDAARTVGAAEDSSARGMKSVAAISSDAASGDIYYLAVTAKNNKMVPGWGADGTGVGRSRADGTPLWFAPSSGGNYMSVSAVNDGKRPWIFAGKSFGGQIDLFDSDGLLLATGNWAWPCNYQIGFVDLRFGVQAYLRPDGKIGAYVEDDAVGRFARCRLEGADSLQKDAVPIQWNSVASGITDQLPDAQRAEGPSLARRLVIPRIAPTVASEKWQPWENISPQIVMLPLVGFKRSVPEDLWQSFRSGTGIGAAAHDGSNLYFYFLIADDSQHFDAEQPGVLWMFDGVELWIEEEQFGLGMTRDGKPALFKFRHHSRDGKPFTANYSLPAENIWAKSLPSLADHPLGRQLATITGVPFEGKPGYAVMAKIPMQDVKLVGGIAGRGGSEILNMTGQDGEVLRIGVAIGGINDFGREQDFKVNWPSTLMFADPTRSAVFELGK